MKARAALRAATSAEHERVDRLFSRLDLADPRQYGQFLLAQATAHLPAEEALDAGGIGALIEDWPQRKRSPLLEADLDDLAMPLPPPLAPPELSGVPALLGALYVLEGSRLGGAMLKAGIPSHLPKRFLDAKQEPGAWRKLLAKLDECLYDAPQVEAATESARQVFMRFEAAGLRYLEPKIAE